MCRPKSHIMSPFLLMAAGYMTENTTLFKTGQRLYLLWRHSSVTWPDPVTFLLKDAQMIPHNLCKISAWSAQPFGGHSRKTHGGLHHPPPPMRARVQVSRAQKDSEDRYTIIEMEYYGAKTALGNVYGHNTDEAAFFLAVLYNFGNKWKRTDDSCRRFESMYGWKFGQDVINILNKKPY